MIPSYVIFVHRLIEGHQNMQPNAHTHKSCMCLHTHTRVCPCAHTHTHAHICVGVHYKILHLANLKGYSKHTPTHIHQGKSYHLHFCSALCHQYPHSCPFAMGRLWCPCVLEHSSHPEHDFCWLWIQVIFPPAFSLHPPQKSVTNRDD